MIPIAIIITVKLNSLDTCEIWDFGVAGGERQTVEVVVLSCPLSPEPGVERALHEGR